MNDLTNFNESEPTVAPVHKAPEKLDYQINYKLMEPGKPYRTETLKVSSVTVDEAFGFAEQMLEAMRTPENQLTWRYLGHSILPQD